MDGMNTSIGDNMFVISNHVPISVGFNWGTKREAPINNDYNKDYFGIDWVKHFVNDL